MWRELHLLVQRRLARSGLWALVFLVLAPCRATPQNDTADVRGELRTLREQNEALQRQLGQQKALIDELTRKVSALAESSRPGLPAPEPDPAGQPHPSAKSSWASGLGPVRLTGEGAAGFFKSGSAGGFPNNEFRVDEARLFLEAPLWQDTYFVGQIDIVTRDELDGLRLSELYVDFEDLSRFWKQNDQLSFRVGRFNIPFGEEYAERNAIQNPLVSHSLSDLWGIDEGVELYGKFGAWRYIVAVQNGGHPSLGDYTEDKSVTGRLSYDPKPWLHLSGSAMRTGSLSVSGDEVSEMWFGGGFFRALGDSADTSEFHANLVEGDVQIKLKRSQLKLAGGWIRSDDNSESADNKRDVYYYYAEASHSVTPRIYAAARFSQILASDGFPIVGGGDWGKYFDDELTTNLWRLSLGAGYRFSPGLVLKGEYSLQEGRTLAGEKRFHENLFAMVVAFQF